MTDMFFSDYADDKLRRLQMEHPAEFAAPPTTRIDRQRRAMGVLAAPSRISNAGMVAPSDMTPAPALSNADTFDVLDGARSELAARLGLSVGEVDELVTLAAEGERDADSQAAGLLDLASKTEGMTVQQARKVMRTMHSFLHQSTGVPDDDEDLKEDAERARRAKRHHGNHPGSEGDDDFGDGIDTGGPSGGIDAGGNVAASAVDWRNATWRTVPGQAGRAVASDRTVKLTHQEYEPGSPVAAEVDRYVALASAFVPTSAGGPGKQGSGMNPAVSGTDPEGSPAVYQNLPEIHDVGSTSDLDSSGRLDVDAVLKRLAKDNPNVLSQKKPYHENVTYPPAAQRRRDEDRALAGGRPQT